jgi:hypothetical protein
VVKVDWTGQRLGKLSVLHEVASKINDPRWLVRCDCGKEFEIYSGRLKHQRHCKSCGLVRLDLKGKTFGFLTVLEPVGSTPQGVAMWKCLCNVCGNETVKRGHLVASGRTSSCGCFNKLVTSRNKKGVPKTPEMLAKMSKTKRDSGCHRGANNWRWKGGVTPLMEQIRKCFDMYEWKEVIRSRDHNACQICGSGKKLDVHHVITLSQGGNLQNKDH